MGDVSVNFSMLRDSVEFYGTTSTANGSGGFVVAANNSPSFTLLAKLIPFENRKVEREGGVFFESGFDVLIRYESGSVPTESMIAKVNSQSYRIKDIKNVNFRNKAITFKLVKK